MGMESDGLTFEQMEALIAGAAERGAWLVFAGHEVSERGPQTMILPELEMLLEYARSADSGIWLDTVAAVGE